MSVRMRLTGSRAEVEALTALLGLLGFDTTDTDLRASRNSAALVRGYLTLTPISADPTHWIKAEHDMTPRGGFVPEAHFVVCCHVCGQVYTEHGDEGICFDSSEHAADYLDARAAAVGWFYDGDRVFCDACRCIERCVQAGHHLYPIEDGPCEVCSAPWPMNTMRCCGTPMASVGPIPSMPGVPLLLCRDCGHYEPDERHTPDRTR
ncbi:hypothetical protein ACWEKT_39330 [Nocardia takedensis]